MKRNETLEDLYPQWLEYKAAETSLANAHSLGNDWAKYYEGDPLTRRKMASIKVPELLQWFLRKIAEHNLTRRKFRDMKTVLNSMLDYAVGMGFVEKNVSRYVPGISTKHFAIEVRKDKTERVYLEDETGSLIDVCLERFEKTHNTAYLGICMNLYLGLRVGELIALKVSDFSDSFVHIEREEIKHHEKKGNVITRNGYEVAPYVKTPQSVRDVPLTSQARRFLSMILAENEKNGVHSEHVFLDKKTGERLHNDSINNILRKYVNPRLNTPQKANHSLRRTYLSTLDASGRLTDEEIREAAGHRHISTTRDNYLYSRKEDSHKVLAFEKALCGNSVTPDNQKTSKSQNAKAPETA